MIVYYESRKRELKTRPTYECWSDERLKTKPEKSTHLGYTGLLGELEHLKTKTRLIDEMFASERWCALILKALLLCDFLPSLNDVYL